MEPIEHMKVWTETDTMHNNFFQKKNLKCEIKIDDTFKKMRYANE